MFNVKTALVTAAVLLVSLLSLSEASAQPIPWCAAGTSARAEKQWPTNGPAPVACRVVSCKTVGMVAGVVVSGDLANPSCTTGCFSALVYKIVNAPWAALPLCPAVISAGPWK